MLITAKHSKKLVHHSHHSHDSHHSRPSQHATYSNEDENEEYFSGVVGNDSFTDLFPRRNLKGDFWRIEAVDKDPDSSDKRVIILEYYADKEVLSPGRYTFPLKDEHVGLLSVIYMNLAADPEPAYLVEEGTVEFIVNEDNSVSGGIDAYFHDIHSVKTRIQIIFKVA